MATIDDEAHAPFDLPAPISRGPTTVRPMRVDDTEALHAAILGSLDHLRPFMVWAVHEPVTLGDRRAFLEDMVSRAQAGTDLTLGLFEGDELVGACGLHRRVGPGGLEIGYWVHADHVDRGHATRAAAIATDVAFTHAGVSFVEIQHDVANLASRRVPEKLGFALVDHDRPVAPVAPAETGRRHVWRMTAGDWLTAHR